MSDLRASLLAYVDLTRPALVTGERSWSWEAYVAEASRRAHGLTRFWSEGRPRHVGILADNTPEMAFHLAAAGLGTHVVVGLNTTRRGEALLADIRKADCAVVLAEPAYADLLTGLDVGVPVLDPTTHDWGQATEVPLAEPHDDDLFMLVFTSGTGGAPKAVRVTHRKVTFPGRYLTEKLGIARDDVLFSAMPLFHSNGVMANWALSVVNGCTVALPSSGRFSASTFLDDVRRHGATYVNYVGKPLSYVLATPERDDDADNPLRLAFGNEAGERDLARFAERFGCRVVDGFGSSENAVIVSRTPETPPGALGVPQPGVKILAPDGSECPVAARDETGRVTNLDECVGELVNTTGQGQFAGYYRDDAATAERMRDGMYWSGDLAYADADGFYWFAGRTADWLRVDGENLAAAPIEAILLRHPDVAQAAVYAVPDDVGDLLVAALVLRPDADLDPASFEAFLAVQPDLSPKAWPRVVRLLDALPTTPTNKILKRELRAEGLAGRVWTREPRASAYRQAPQPHAPQEPPPHPPPTRS